MGELERRPLEESALTEASRAFGERLFARFPHLRAMAEMERTEGCERWSLVVKVPSLSGQPDATLVVWVEDGGEPSVGFGGWHTHESVWEVGLDGGSQSEDLLDLVAGIFSDRFIACVDVGGRAPGRSTILDLTVADAVLDELTSPYAAERIQLVSWTGRCGAIVGLDDYDAVVASNPALRATRSRVTPS